jgi:hypothetical protein
VSAEDAELVDVDVRVMVWKVPSIVELVAGLYPGTVYVALDRLERCRRWAQLPSFTSERVRLSTSATKGS